MSDLRCASTLVEAADRDVEVVLLMLEHRGGSDQVFGFHVQQAVEKLLKAWLAIRGERHPHTHDLQGPSRGALVRRTLSGKLGSDLSLNDFAVGAKGVKHSSIFRGVGRVDIQFCTRPLLKDRVVPPEPVPSSAKPVMAARGDPCAQV